jgi:endogenous inhibitor of DNA gyrase (YacG/DUF329 family)
MRPIVPGICHYCGANTPCLDERGVPYCSDTCKSLDLLEAFDREREDYPPHPWRVAPGRAA